jgi:hypothetical protein
MKPMDTKEAIEILYNVTVYNQKSSEFNKFKREFQNIVNLLVRGEKCEQIVKELENLDFMDNKHKLLFNWESFNDLITALKQKYFPKEV